MRYKTILFAVMIAVVGATALAASKYLGLSQLDDEKSRALAWRQGQVKVLQALLLDHPPRANKAETVATARRHGFVVKEDPDAVWIGDVFLHFENGVISGIDTY